MARYPKQDDPGGKNVIPSVTEIIGDCTDKSGALTQWAANMVVGWIKENCIENISGVTANPTISYYVTESELNEARFNFKTVSQKALNIGSEVHNAIEVYLKREIARNDDGEPHWDITDPVYSKLGRQAMNSFNAFNAWQKEHNLKPIALEQTVYGDGWAGTLDFYGYFDSKLYVIDWKSSKAHYPEMRYQVAAYLWAIRQQIIGKYDPTFEEWPFVERNYLPKGCGVLRLDKETGLPHWKDTSKSYEQDLRIFNRMVDLYFERHPIIRKRARG